MKRLDVVNPFGAPVYHEQTVVSTMDFSRNLALQEPHGTVITADFQEQGRGRIRDRYWNTERGESLLFTILLRYPRQEEIPPALTLRAGLSAALAIEDFLRIGERGLYTGNGVVLIKWPNDIFISGNKVAGILAEADGGNVHLGIGINVCQKRFPEHLRNKATSIGLVSGRKIESRERFTLLEMMLARLYAEITTANTGWKNRVEARLFKKGEPVNFMEGAADSGKIVSGALYGLGDGGELLIIPDGETGARAFTTGELTGIY